MGRFRITRNNNKEVKQLLQAKLDSSLIEEVNLLCKWSGNEKNCVIAMRRERRTAKVAMARRLAVRLFWMLHRQWDY